MQERKLKGINFHGTLRALEKRNGPEVAARVRAKVRGEAGDALRNGAIVSGGWYPASWYDALLAAIEEEFPDERWICRDLSRAAVTEDFGTLFRAMSLIVSPNYALMTATRVGSRYVDGGKITLVESREGHIHFLFEEFHGYTRRMWEDFIGGMEAVVSLMRVRLLPTRIVRGGRDGDAVLEVIIRYARS